MRKKTMDFDNGELRATIIVREARLVDGMERGKLIGQAFENRRQNEMEQTVQVVIWPNLVAGTHQANIELDGQTQEWPKFETLLELPETLVQQWLEAVFELNPRWQPQQDQPEGEESAEKKGG